MKTNQAAVLSPFYTSMRSSELNVPGRLWTVSDQERLQPLNNRTIEVATNSVFNFSCAYQSFSKRHLILIKNKRDGIIPGMKDNHHCIFFTHAIQELCRY
jgi:hypothetical protein